MKSPNSGLKKIGNSTGLLVLTLSLFLVACVTRPPDVAVCSPNDAADFYVMRTKFLKLCSEDLTCEPELETWRQKFLTWSAPSDSAHCVYTVSGKTFEVDSKRLFPGRKKWTEISATAVVVPAVESWAPIKTFIQTYCHDNPNCASGVGQWEAAIESIDKIAFPYE